MSILLNELHFRSLPIARNMFRNKYQRGLLTIFYSIGSKPLEIWETHIRNGYVKRFLDQDIKTMVLEIRGANVSTTYINCPRGNDILGITMPFLVMIVKNLKKYFSFEVTILDDTGTRRRFRVSNFQSTTQIQPLCTVMPIGLAPDWNQIQFNLAEFTRRAYNKQFVEVQKLKINANIRLRRVYFTERLYDMDELPAEYKLYFPLEKKHRRIIERKASKGKENINIEQKEIQEDAVKIHVSTISVKSEVLKKNIDYKASISSIKNKSVSELVANVKEDINEEGEVISHNQFIITILDEAIETIFKNKNDNIQ